MAANRIEVAKRYRGVSDPLPLVWTGEVPNLTDGRNRHAIIAKLKAVSSHLWHEHSLRLGAVIVDTVSSAFGMRDENDNAEAARIVCGLREIGAALGALILPVHHYGKTADSGLRGGSAFRANTDGVISVNAKRNETTGEVTERSLAVAKYRNGEEGPIGGFDLKWTRLGDDEHGDEYGNCYVEPLGLIRRASNTRRLSDRQRLGLEALQHLVAEYGRPMPLSFGLPPDLRSVQIEQWRNEVTVRGLFGIECKNPRAEFNRLKDALAARHMAAERDGHVWLVKSSSEACQ